MFVSSCAALGALFRVFFVSLPSAFDDDDDTTGLMRLPSLDHRDGERDCADGGVRRDGTAGTR